MTLPSGPGSRDPDEAPSEEFDDERPEARASAVARPRKGASARQPLQLALLAGLVVLVAAGALIWRARHRAQIVTQGLARAEVLLRIDTAAGYREAERLLEPLAELDAVDPPAMRGFALAMLALDYRDADAARKAEALLVEPGRAAEPPRWVNLGYGALALARSEAGTAMSYAVRTGDGPFSALLQARIALLAGKVDAAREPLERAAAADPRAPGLHALRGDVLRRLGHLAPAREAYLAALAASPLQARAAFGMAKLAQSNGAGVDEAREPLRRLLDDVAGTPSNERARAAYHLAVLETRAGRPAEAAAALDRAGVDPAGRAWLDRAVAEAARATTHRAPPPAPAALQSASDDDPYVPPPPPPPSTAISPTFRLPEPAPRAAAKPATKAPLHAAHAAKPAKAAAKPAAKAAAKPHAAKAPPKPTARTATAKKQAAHKAPPKPAVAAKKPAPHPAAKPASSAATPPKGSAIDDALSKVGAQGGDAPRR